MLPLRLHYSPDESSLDMNSVYLMSMSLYI